ncbi:MAG TPA: MgtC/SapB family protein [Alphaproteobacteria bacterium]|nr:MgtC/SapB family protein [Alphaproteobacteria bacterium]
MAWQETVVRIAVALMLGSIIGFERQWRQRMAGLRTNALVAIGAASFVIFSGMIQPDSSPTRVAAQVVSGIGFLGAGVILREGVNVRGLNTAATLWCSAAVGVFSGAGFLWQAAIAAFFVVVTNLFLRPLVRLINRGAKPIQDGETQYVVTVVCRGVDEAHIRALLLQGVAGGALSLRRLDSANIENMEFVEVGATLASVSRADAALEQIVGRLSLEPTVTAARWRVESGLE